MFVSVSLMEDVDTIPLEESFPKKETTKSELLNDFFFHFNFVIPTQIYNQTVHVMVVELTPTYNLVSPGIKRSQNKPLKNRVTALPVDPLHLPLPPLYSCPSYVVPHRPICHPSIIMRSESNVLQYE